MLEQFGRWTTEEGEGEGYAVMEHDGRSITVERLQYLLAWEVLVPYSVVLRFRASSGGGGRGVRLGLRMGMNMHAVCRPR